MNLINSLLLALGFISAEPAVPPLDIPYFSANPELRSEMLKRCHNDYALARTPVCENAEAAGTLTMGRPLSSWQENEIPLLLHPKRQDPPPPPATVIQKGEERAI